MAAGSRLPSEAQLVDEFGVSRTVVREAIARLRSDGLVSTRAGLGAFVADSLRALPFRLTAANAKPNVREVFELRLGLEAEAAALAAERGTPDQVAAIAAAKDAMAGAMADGGDGVEEDFQFHRAIAEATNNSIYRSFLSFLEHHLREQMQITRRWTRRAARLDDVEREHAGLVEAITARDPDRAREAARAHLRAGIKRLDELGPSDE
jgi:DNA-binding FadR family transcriptional regulator